jgi:hypothetical protein
MEQKVRLLGLIMMEKFHVRWGRRRWNEFHVPDLEINRVEVERGDDEQLISQVFIALIGDTKFYVDHSRLDAIVEAAKDFMELEQFNSMKVKN